MKKSGNPTHVTRFCFVAVLLAVALLLIAPVAAQQVVGTDLSISKTASAPTTTGEPITYTLTVDVPSPGSTGFVITDTLPTGFDYEVIASAGWSPSFITRTLPLNQPGQLIASYNPQGVITGTYTLLVRAVPLVTQTLMSVTQSVVVSGNEPDPNPENNSTSVPIMVGSVSATVPTLRDWGIVLLTVLLVGGGLFRLRTTGI